MQFNQISRGIIGAAIEVHRELGPGKDEQAYEDALAHELSLCGIRVKQQRAVPIVYKGEHLDCGYRIDILVENSVVAEVKSVEAINPVHAAQVLTYLRLGRWKLGLLLNFNVAVMRHGVRRFVQGLHPGYDNTWNASRPKGATANQRLDSGDKEAERLAGLTIQSAFCVYNELGPGLLNSSYETCLCRELSLNGIPFERKKTACVSYKGRKLKPDELAIVVGGKVVVSPHAIARILPVHSAQVISQIRLGGYPLGLLFNFHEPRFADGIKRFVFNPNKLMIKSSSSGNIEPLGFR